MKLIMLKVTIVEVTETKDYRLVVSQTEREPWPNNPYEQYTFRDDERFFSLGDVQISAVRP